MNDLPVREVMTRDFVGVSESDDLLEAVRTIRNADATGALVLRGGEPVGYLSAGAVLDHLVDRRRQRIHLQRVWSRSAKGRCCWILARWGCEVNRWDRDNGKELESPEPVQSRDSRLAPLAVRHRG